jgi:prepilin-type processing-associated H-X9-DG protein
MLLPALGKAREKAKTSACLNNLKQIGTGIQMYALDNADWMPDGWQTSSYFAGPVVPYIYAIQLNSYVGGKSQTELKKSFDRLSPTFQCPANELETKIITVSSTGLNVKATNYMYNARIGHDFYEMPRKLSRCRDATNGIVMIDGKPNTRNCWVFDIPYPSYTDWMPFIHNQGNNFLYVDGHSGWKTRFADSIEEHYRNHYFISLPSWNNLWN